ncbi:MAG TPA: YihY/virulence factor BrkB family protein [Thermoleophilaceae bacterium]|nr:YihY/virulence factor BrkB family protein [Thermoleophilaceae bacterium]
MSAKPLLSASWRAVNRMIREHFTGTAAELAYYGLLSAVPCVAAFVGILGLIGSHPATTEAVDTIVRDGGGSVDVAGVAADAARGVVESNGSAGLALGAGLVTTLWVASVYLAAFQRAAYRVHDKDPIAAWRARPLQLLLTFVSLVLLAVTALALVATKAIVTAIGEAVGAEDATVTIWSIGRWLLALAVIVIMIAALFDLAPRDDGQRRKLISAGSLAAVLAWLLASAGFEIWVDNFASYDATYGALAGVIAFAVWLWISNLALLFGLILDLELYESRRSSAASTS